MAWLGLVILLILVLGLPARTAVAATLDCKDQAVHGYSAVGVIPYTTKAAARNSAIQAWITSAAFFGL